MALNCPRVASFNLSLGEPRSELWASKTRHSYAPNLGRISGKVRAAVFGADENSPIWLSLRGRFRIAMLKLVSPGGFARNSLETPTVMVLDLRVLKYFPFGGTKHLDLVAESFNLLNRANVAQINPVFGSGLTPIAGFGQPTEALGSRQIQFSLDFEF
jgi:hypothetical protein